MASNILIVESPAKSKTIEKYLGPDYKVLASYGHIRDLPSKDGSVDTEHDFEMHYQVPKDSEKAIKAIVDAVKKADKVYLATDLDREGEAISWHVLEELKARIKNFEKEKEVLRIAFSEITKKAVQHAVDNPRELAMPMVNAQQARRALDYLVGFNLSPVLWKKVRRGLSAGRVQSVALRLICEREDEITAFKPQEYWSIHGEFKTPEEKMLKAKLTHLNGEKLEKFSLGDETSATDAVKILEAGTYHIGEIKKKQVKRNPAAPFITSTLQMEASRKLGFGAKKAMMAAQKLYEAGLITYMRTDSVNLSGEAIAACRDYIGTTYGEDFVPAKPNMYKTKSQNAQEAHEAIRPTDFKRRKEDIRIGEAEAKLYDLIWKRTIACQMAQAKLDQTSLIITDETGKHSFRASGSILTFAGFLKVYREGMDDGKSDDLDDSLLPVVNEKDAMDLCKVNPDQHFTEPPPRFSEATLVKALEERSIGRPSTYASIVSTIQDRGYVRLEKKRFRPEDVGQVVAKFLTEHFTQYVDYDFTANMEETLDEVARGEKEWKPMLREFWSPFKERVDDKTLTVKKSDITSESTGETCPECGTGEMLIRLGRYGKFKGCNNYPQCKHIINIPKEGEEEGEAQVREEPKDTGIQCPKCKEANIVEKKSRRGKIFYGCGGWPKCKNAMWDAPIEEPCPKCNWPLTSKKEYKNGTVVTSCGSQECEWQDPPKPEKKSAKKDEGDKKPATKKKATAAKKTTAKKSTAKKAPAKKATTKKAAAKTEETNVDDINAAIAAAMDD